MSKLALDSVVLIITHLGPLWSCGAEMMLPRPFQTEIADLFRQKRIYRTSENFPEMISDGLLLVNLHDQTTVLVKLFLKTALFSKQQYIYKEKHI